MSDRPSKWLVYLEDSPVRDDRTLRSFFPASKRPFPDAGKSDDEGERIGGGHRPHFDLGRYRAEKENRIQKENDKILEQLLHSLEVKRHSFDFNCEPPKKPRIGGPLSLLGVKPKPKPTVVAPVQPVRPIRPVPSSILPAPSVNRNICSYFPRREEIKVESVSFDEALAGIDFDQDLEEEEDKKEESKPIIKPIVPLTSTIVVKPSVSKPVDIPPNHSIYFDHGDDNLLVEDEEKVEKVKMVKMVEPLKPLKDQKPEVLKNIDMYSLISVKPIKRISVEVASRELPKELVSIENIPARYRPVFAEYKKFNSAQSKIFHDAYMTKKTIVISAPTGSGKTAIFELAIARMLYLSELAQLDSTFKVVYIAPLKTLCHERYLDWQKKFSDLGLSCVEMTGDSEDIHYRLLSSSNLIFATPEKWDTLARFTGFEKIVKSVKLILIDEVHLLADKNRGPKLEAIITRFKAMQKRVPREELNFRFIAVSATAPNTDDLAQWLGDEASGAVCYNLDDRFRAVTLTKKVIGYPCPESVNDFLFIQKLNYKLPSLIKEYSKGRPTLIFVCTRRDCQTTAEFLARESCYCPRPEQKQSAYILAKSVSDNKLKATLTKGVGYHHAGLTPDDRHKLEMAFLNGSIPVLIATSTLAMGVNFPAHLVIIKGTSHYVSGSFIEYGESQILQMMGRAGRPQFDDHGCAIILTKSKNETKYQKLVSGEKVIESYIHLSLAEIFMAEIERHTITNINQTAEWVQSTLFYIRIHKDKLSYGLNQSWTEERVDQKIRDICIKELNGLRKYGLIEIDGETGAVKATEIGRMMAIKSISYQTMCTFMELKGNESLRDLLIVLAKCQDVNQDVNLRNNEKKHLNQFNVRPKSEATRVIRFPFTGKIKTKEMKINVLIQATLGCIPFPKDSGLLQETGNLMKAAQRLSRFLVDVAFIKATNAKFLLNCIILAKCLRAGIWENSKFVSKQLPKIGLELSSRLVDADLTTFQRIEAADPRTIEMFCRRALTFGEFVIKESQRIPKYTVTIERSSKTSLIGFPQAISIKIFMLNWKFIESEPRRFDSHSCVLLISDQSNRILEKQRIVDKRLIKENGVYEKYFPVPAGSSSIFIHFIDEFYAGTDVSLEYLPKYLLSNEAETVRKIQSINQADNMFKISPKDSKEGDRTQKEASVRFDDELDEIQISEEEEIEIRKPKPKSKPKPKPKSKPKSKPQEDSDPLQGIGSLFDDDLLDLPEYQAADFSDLMEGDDINFLTGHGL